MNRTQCDSTRTEQATHDTRPSHQYSESTDQPAGEVLYCANHPETETYLRCNKCDKPICLKCAELTEVGYRCKECIREQQNVFYNALTSDNWIAFAVAAGITAVAWPIVALLLRMTGFFGWIIAALSARAPALVLPRSSAVRSGAGGAATFAILPWLASWLDCC